MTQPMPEEIKTVVSNMITAGESEENIKLVIEQYGAEAIGTAPSTRGSVDPWQAAMSPEFMPGVTPGVEGVGAKVAEVFGEMPPRAKGAMVGSIYGSRFGTGGTLAGGVIGGIAGETGQQLYETWTKAEEAPKNVNDVMNRMTIGIVKSGAEELAGAGIYKIGSKVVSPFGKAVTEQGKIAWQILEKYMPRKVPPVTPAEMTESWGLDLAQNIAEKSWLGGRTMSSYKNVIRPEAVNKLIDDTATAFGREADPVAMGNLITEVSQNNWKNYRKAVTDPLYNRIEMMVQPVIKKVPKYKMVDTGLIDSAGKPITKEVADGFIEKEIGGVQISITDLKKAVADQYRKIEKLPSFGGDSAGDNIVVGITKMSDNVDFGTAKELRTRLRVFAEDLSVTNKKAPGVGLAKHLGKTLDDSVSAALKEQNKEAYYMWKEVNKLYKKGSQQYNNRFLRQLIRQADPDKGFGQPEMVLKTIFKNQGISGIKKVKAAIGNQEWHKLKGWYVRELLLKSTNKDGVVVGTAFKNKMFGSSGMGKNAMQEIFTQEEIKFLDNNAITLGVLQAKQASGTGGMLIQLMQPAGLFGLGAGYYASGAAILVGPEVMARMLLSPKIARWMTSTAKLPSKTGVVVSNTARLAGFADEIQNAIYKEKQE